VDPRLAEERAWRGVVAWNREAVKGERLRQEAESAARMAEAADQRAAARRADAERRVLATRHEIDNHRTIQRDARKYQAWMQLPPRLRAEERAQSVQEKLDDYEVLLFRR
jgi:hypothetical protein